MGRGNWLLVYSQYTVYRVYRLYRLYRLYRVNIVFRLLKVYSV